MEEKEKADVSAGSVVRVYWQTACGSSKQPLRIRKK